MNVNEGTRFTEYWKHMMDRFRVLSPMAETKTSCLFDVDIHVKGGGLSGQAQAARRALAFALLNADRS